MADLNNLLAELDELQANVSDSGDNNVDTISAEHDTTEEEVIEHTVEPEVPPILAAAAQSGPSVPTNNDSLDDGFAPDEDYTRLRSLWVREMLSPELMSYQDDTINMELELLLGQEETIEKYAQQQQQSGKDQHETALLADITKLDAARVKFIVQDLLTSRLNKIEEHALYNREVVDRMSDEEVKYLKSYGELLEKHFKRTVLDHLPKDAWKKLDDPGMIDSPDLNKFVFCRVLHERVEIDNTLEGEEKDDMNIQEHQQGACLIVRYGAIKSLLSEEKVELLM
mmetsp:Transcript_2120/g.3129  ORF Transcript_2120/g.3129 Transcript_2120/m.3129 type:complete len:283 (+) Transcript_2120:86-934(+)|eukprot:CAMPEP_0194256912 /NCGR_PEP_ID=MMETSP0158-20130606/37808_1 /TAXON_ID=33649 /ORGANISM="Thalassionema nitzschioides, Strain L26-B" /LENGTH=282 /DNA_ID=CAMNT_0038995777 /DNA_START=38 /DNA_END=886 /DNA_ORIENTATION=-